MPFLDAMLPRAWGAAAAPQPKRMFCICTVLGMHAQNFFPEGAGRDYKASRYLELLKEHRAQNPDEQVLRGIQLTINGISAGLRNSG